jgi:oligopeptidase B
MTKSEDGTKVPYVLISSCNKPSALLCIVYGAYGIDTHMNVDRWKPLLARGWGLCLALVRGGGDHDDEWAEAARRENRYKSVEDFEACVAAARRHFHLPASVTAVYGRSAGGYLIGSCLARHTDGDLFGAVYTEVPYVDVLNTTANRELPLTELEYDEFGDPRHRLEDFSTLLHLSPVDSLPPGGAPKIFVLDRTALHDKEVFAYESMKWITRLQELDENHKETLPKLLAIAENEGHFATGSAATRERAEDMALLHGWLRKKSNVGIYEMTHRKNRKETRKNRKANRKTRKANRKNRK